MAPAFHVLVDMGVLQTSRVLAVINLDKNLCVATDIYGTTPWPLAYPII